MFDKLEKVVARHSELADLLSKPEVTNDTNQYRKLTKEYADLQELVETFAEYKTTKKSVEENRDPLRGFHPVPGICGRPYVCVF